jgi:hypothetical protein
MHAFQAEKQLASRSERAAINKIGSSPMVLDLPEGQGE